MCEPVHEFSKKLRWMRFLGGVIEPMMRYGYALGRLKKNTRWKRRNRTMS
jgi:hypothetical protein